MGGTRTARTPPGPHPRVPLTGSWHKVQLSIHPSSILHPSSCCRGKGKRGEEQKADRGKADLKLRATLGGFACSGKEQNVSAPSSSLHHMKGKVCHGARGMAGTFARGQLGRYQAVALGKHPHRPWRLFGKVNTLLNLNDGCRGMAAGWPCSIQAQQQLPRSSHGVN